MKGQLDYARGGVRVTTDTAAGTIEFLAMTRDSLPVGRPAGIRKAAHTDDLSLEWDGRRYTGRLRFHAYFTQWVYGSRHDSLTGEQGQPIGMTAFHGLCDKVLIPAVEEAFADPGIRRQLRAAEAAWARDIASRDAREAQKKLEQLEEQLEQLEEDAGEACEALLPGEDNDPGHAPGSEGDHDHG